MTRSPLVLVLTLFACAEGTTSDEVTQDSGLDTTQDCWQVEAFPELVAHSANAAWDAPAVEVTCGGGELRVQSNGIPTFEFVSITPNGLNEQTHDWTISTSPAVAGASSEIPLLGVIGFTVTGLSIFGPNEAAQPDPYGDPVYNSIVDQCLGHTAMGGTYHNHALLAECIVASQDDPSAASPLLGFAADGFPIYGPRGCTDAECAEVVTFESGWVQTGDPSTYAWDNHVYEGAGANDLDPCNGRVGPDGTYRYHATETFPYILGCYAGTGVALGL